MKHINSNQLLIYPESVIGVYKVSYGVIQIGNIIINTGKLK